jgi:SAM-dependent methyltransferase
VATEKSSAHDLTPTSFRKGNVAADADADLRARIFVLDVQEQLPGVQRLRDWTMGVLAPRPGERAVDVGCGAGSEVRRFAALVAAPEGDAIGVEPDPGLRAEAERRTAEAGVTASYLDGDAAALPFEDASVDVLRCERVFQHLSEPDAAAAEFARVLAPGGRAVVVDSDWGTAVQTFGDPDVRRRLDEAAWRRMANPFAGRHLRGQLHRAGLVVDPDIAATAVVMPDDLLRDLAFLRINLDLALEEGVVTAAEGERFIADARGALDAGTAFLAVTMFGVCARRPEAG